MKNFFYSAFAFAIFATTPAFASGLPTENLIPLEIKSIEISIEENTGERNFSIEKQYYDAPAVTLKKNIGSKGFCTLSDFQIKCFNLMRGDNITIQARVREEGITIIIPEESEVANVEIKTKEVSETHELKPVRISENYYRSHDNKVLFTDGISIEREVTDARPENFVEKPGTYAEDKNNFYYGEILVEKTKKDDFKYLGAGFSKKNEKIFIAEKVFEEVEDTKTFEPLEIEANNWSRYSKDIKATYYRFTKIGADTQTIKAIGGNYAVDKENIYFSGAKVSTGNAIYLGEGNYGEYFAQDNGGFLKNGSRILKTDLPEKILQKAKSGTFIF